MRAVRSLRSPDCQTATRFTSPLPSALSGLMSSKLQEEVLRYSKKNGYPISDFSQLNCVCGNLKFHLISDDEQGGAIAICPECGQEHDLESSKEYMEEPVRNICLCDNDRLSIGIGRAYYESSKEVRWVYVVANCSRCGLSGVYVDWKQL